MAKNNRTLENDKVFNIRVPAKLVDRIAVIATRYNISKSTVIRMAITQYVEKEEIRIAAMENQLKAEAINAAVTKPKLR